MNIEKSLIKQFEKFYPLVCIFKIYNKLFAYDAKTELLTELDVEDLQHYIDKPLHDSAVFTPGKLKKIVPDNSDIAILAQSQKQNFLPRKFVLEVTEKCTLRCKYCFFSDQENTRKHSVSEMDESTAFKAINYYFELYTRAFKNIPNEKRTHILNIAPPSLSWWGGEPFSNFKLIQKTKDHFESLPWNTYGIKKDELVYSLVTNFTILNEEIINFIISTNLYLFISLDGNQEANDANRIFENGQGSFNCVHKNINHMIKLHPVFCKKRIIIQSVLADNINKKDALLFLKKEMNINTPECKVLKVIGYPQRNKNQYISKDICNKINEKNILDNYLQILETIKNMTLSDIKNLFKLNKDIEQEFKAIISIEKRTIFDNVIPKEQYIRHFSCPAGIDNIFISTNGDIHICNKTDYSYPFGNVKDGINTNLLEKFYSSFYKEIRNKCSNCWAIHFCNICPASILNDKRFIHPNKMECKHIRKEVLINIKKFILLLQNETLYQNINIYFSEQNVSFLNYDGPININKLEL